MSVAKQPTMLWSRRYVCEHCGHRGYTSDTLADNATWHGVPLAEVLETVKHYIATATPEQIDADLKAAGWDQLNAQPPTPIALSSAAHEAARLIIAEYGPDSTRWAGGGWHPATEQEIAAVIAPALEDNLRRAWEMGFALCRQYGDNHAHFDGEQKERQWALALERLVPGHHARP